VEIQIDKQSFKKAQKAIEDLFNPFKRWKKWISHACGIDALTTTT
jgi:hypothetical protein